MRHRLLLPIIVWPLLATLYAVFAGSLGASELILGGVLATAATAYAAVAHARAERRLAFRAPWLRLAAASFGALPGDVWRVGQALTLGPPGHVETQPFRRGGDDAVEGGRRGLVLLARSLAPNAFVLGTVERGGSLVLHRLAGTGAARADRDWPL